MNEPQISTWVWVTPQRARNNPMLWILRNCRNIVGTLLLSAASFSIAQDKPHGLADDVNFLSKPKEHSVLPSDPSPNMVWHKSFDVDVSLNHIGTRWEVDEGIYSSAGIHWWSDDYLIAAHYVSNLSRNRPFEWHAIKNEMELFFRILKQLNSKTQLQWWGWVFTEQPLKKAHETSAHVTKTNDSHDPHDPHGAHGEEKVEKNLDSHDSGHHERLTIISWTAGVQHVISDKLRLLLSGSVGFDTTWSLHTASSIEFLGTAFRKERFALVYNAGFNYATWIGPSLEWSTGFVITNRAHTGRFFFVGDVNHNLGTDKTVFWLRTGFSLNLERGHH